MRSGDKTVYIEIRVAAMFLYPTRYAILAFVLLAGAYLAGQTSGTLAPKSNEEKEIEKQEQSQRLLGVIPQFGITSRHNASPLTPGEKFHLFAKGAFDPVELSSVSMQSAIGQADDEFPEYGQGVAGYGKRYGVTLADEVSSGFFSNFFYPVLLKEDPRYFRLGENSVRHRVGYALTQQVVCRRDRGGRGFCWENILGALTTGGLSNAYYLPADRGLGLTMSRSAISIGYGSLGGLVNEFYPDFTRWLFHRHDKRLLKSLDMEPSEQRDK